MTDLKNSKKETSLEKLVKRTLNNNEENKNLLNINNEEDRAKILKKDKNPEKKFNLKKKKDIVNNQEKKEKQKEEKEKEIQQKEQIEKQEQIEQKKQIQQKEQKEKNLQSKIHVKKRRKIKKTQEQKDLEEKIRRKGEIICLGIESTAHTFGVGIITNKARILANISDTYKPSEGGLHPQKVVEHHYSYFDQLIRKALKIAKLKITDIDLIAFSQGPGIGPVLRIGAAVARSLALGLKKPIIGINHCIAHVEIGRVLNEVKDPITLYVSGGNTLISAFESGKYQVVGETLDIPLGNLLDMVARDLGIPHPGGPMIEKLAKKYKENKKTKINLHNNLIQNEEEVKEIKMNNQKDENKEEIQFNLPYIVKGMDLSYSGLYSSARTYIKKYNITKDHPYATALCFSLQETAFAMLAEVFERAIAHTKKPNILLTGGVAANKRLQEMINKVAEDQGVGFNVVPKGVAGDNGVMIAYTGLLKFISIGGDHISETNINPKWRMDEVPIPWREKITNEKSLMETIEYRERLEKIDLTIREDIQDILSQIRFLQIDNEFKPVLIQKGAEAEIIKCKLKNHQNRSIRKMNKKESETENTIIERIESENINIEMIKNQNKYNEEESINSQDKARENKYKLIGKINNSIILKYRRPKKYRTKKLDINLRMSRTVKEAKIISELFLKGFPVPALREVLPDKGLLVFNEINGTTLHQLLLSKTPEPDKILKELNGAEYILQRLWKTSTEATELSSKLALLFVVGYYLRWLHHLNISHGDLTTSNILIPKSLQIFFIDFGLAKIDITVEDASMDLHLLKRVLHGSYGDVAPLFYEWVCRGYRSFEGAEQYWPNDKSIKEPIALLLPKPVIDKAQLIISEKLSKKKTQKEKIKVKESKDKENKQKIIRPSIENAEEIISQVNKIETRGRYIAKDKR